MVASGAKIGERGGQPATLTGSPADVLTLFLRLLPAAYFDELGASQRRRQNNRVYTNAVVMWLLIAQRLQANGTLETAVLELVRGLPEVFWPEPCKRLQVGPEGQKPKLSSNTASYDAARQALPVKVVEQAFERVFEDLIRETAPLAQAGRRAFFLDGTTVRMPHTAALCAAYPPGSNQHGECHWPLLRMLVAHDLDTGLAMRPQWGPVHGDQAVSEQSLLELAIDRLPKYAVLVGDANFGVFSVAYGADQRSRPVVLRLSSVRAQCLAGGPLQDGTDRRIQWKPTRWDRKSHPQLPADACVEGRLIVRQVQPSDGKAPFLLALFTTLKDHADQIIAIYGKRWDIETDLRHLKGTLGLEQLTCIRPEMVAKEIDAALMTYNLVRGVTCLAAQKAGLPPRSFGFKRVRNVIHAFTPLIAAAKDPQDAAELVERMMYYVGQAKLYQRKRPSYPRAVWGNPRTFPTRKA